MEEIDEDLITQALTAADYMFNMDMLEREDYKAYATQLLQSYRSDSLPIGPLGEEDQGAELSEAADQAAKEPGMGSKPQCSEWTKEKTQYLEVLYRNPKTTLKEKTQLFNDRFDTELIPQQICERWNRVQNPVIKKGRFTETETQLIQKYLQQNLSVEKIHEHITWRSLQQLKRHISGLHSGDKL